MENLVTLLRASIQFHKHLINEPIGGDFIDCGALLGAIAHCESSLGLHREFGRRESAYAKGGMYFKNHVVDLYNYYGDFVSMSYGSWQIMFVTAWELGYRNHPSDLIIDDVSLPWVIEFINVRAFSRGAMTPEEVFDAYNSGNHNDSIVPFEYIEKAMDFYNENIGNF